MNPRKPSPSLTPALSQGEREMKGASGFTGAKRKVWVWGILSEKERVMDRTVFSMHRGSVSMKVFSAFGAPLRRADPVLLAAARLDHPD